MQIVWEFNKSSYQRVAIATGQSCATSPSSINNQRCVLHCSMETEHQLRWRLQSETFLHFRYRISIKLEFLMDKWCLQFSFACNVIYCRGSVPNFVAGGWDINDIYPQLSVPHETKIRQIFYHVPTSYNWQTSITFLQAYILIKVQVYSVWSSVLLYCRVLFIALLLSYLFFKFMFSIHLYSFSWYYWGRCRLWEQ